MEAFKVKKSFPPQGVYDGFKAERQTNIGTNGCNAHAVSAACSLAGQRCGGSICRYNKRVPPFPVTPDEQRKDDESRSNRRAGSDGGKKGFQGKSRQIAEKNHANKLLKVNSCALPFSHLHPLHLWKYSALLRD